MKVEIDFGECVSAYAKEQKNSYGYYGYAVDNLKGPMAVLLDAARNYEEAVNIVIDLLETIPNGYRERVMEDRGYQKIPEEA